MATTKITISHSGTNRAILLDENNYVYDGTWVVFTDLDWGTYILVPTQLGTSKLYAYTVPSIPAGEYTLVIYDGASPVVTATPIKEVKFTWTGTEVYHGGVERRSIERLRPRVRYVKAGATGLANGDTWVDAYTTIAAAYAAAVDGDTIYIGAGVYYESINCAKSLTFRGIGSGTILSKNTSTGYILQIVAHSCVIEDLAFDVQEDVSDVTCISAGLIKNLVIQRVTINNVAKTGADYNGIGIYADRLTNLILDGVDVFCGNICAKTVNNVNTQFRNSSFITSSATPTGGSTYCLPVDATGSLYMRNCLVKAINNSGGLSNVTGVKFTGSVSPGLRVLENCAIIAEQQIAASGHACVGVQTVGTPGTRAFIVNTSIRTIYTSGTAYHVLSSDVNDKIEVVNSDVESSKFSPLPGSNPLTQRITTNAIKQTDMIWREILSDHEDVDESAAATLITMNGVADAVASKPTAAQIRSEIDTNSTKLIALTSSVGNITALMPADTIASKSDVETGVTLTVVAGSTVNSLNVLAPAGINLTHLEDAIVFTNTVGRTKALVRINNATGTSPNFTLPVTPALPSIPLVGDTFILGPKYIDTGAL